MTKTIDQIFDEYFEQQEAIRAEYDARRARLASTRPAEGTTSRQPTIISGWYSSEQYEADYAAGRSTD
jgi:hypothetical protein